MGLIKKIKSNWMAMSTTDKIMIVFDGIAGIMSGVCLYSLFSKKKYTIPDKNEDVPKQNFPLNPRLGEPVEKRDIYEQAVKLYDDLEIINDKFAECDITQEELDFIRQESLDLAWDIAAMEGKMEEAENGQLPYQLYD